MSVVEVGLFQERKCSSEAMRTERRQHRRQQPVTYICERCGGVTVVYLHLVAGRCGCGGRFTLRGGDRNG